jgi:hypothetical protein
MAQSGYTPILIYASGTATNVPLAANMTSSASGAELALNYADGKLYYKNSSGVVTLLAGAGGAGIVAGSNTQVQYNNSGVFGASANLTFNGTTLTAGGLTTTGTTSTGVLSVTGNTTLGDAAGDTVTVNGTITSNLIFTDNTYDIGASGATRPRNLYLSSTVNIANAGYATLVNASSANAWSSGYFDIATFYVTNMTAGAVSLNVGKAAGTNNSGKIAFNYAGGSGSTANYVEFGLFNNDGLFRVYGTGNLSNVRSNASVYSGSNSATWVNGLALSNNATPATGVSNLINFGGASNVNAVYGVVQNASGYGDFVWAGYNGAFSELGRFTSAGNFGVGIASPAYPLDVNGQAQITTGLRITAATSSLYTVDGTLSRYSTSNGVYLTGNNLGWLGLQADGTQATTIVLWGAGEANTPNRIAFKTNSVERASISSTGRVAINNGDYTVIVGSVNGKTPNGTGFSLGYNPSGGSGEAQLVWGTGGSTYPFIISSYDGSTTSERARFLSTGNLVVGGTVQKGAARISVVQEGGSLASTTVTRSNMTGIAVGDITTTGNLGNGIWFDHGSLMAGIASARTATSNWGTDLRFYTHPTATSLSDEAYERMRLDPAGNFIIGDTAQQYSAQLYVNGSIAARNGGVDGTYQNAFVAGYTSNYNERNIIQTAVSSGSGSGFRFQVSAGGGSASVTNAMDVLKNGTYIYGLLNVAAPTSSGAGTSTIADNGSSPNNLRVYNQINSNNTANRFIICDTAASVLKFDFYTNGGLANFQANNVNLSDRREKTNFAPAKSYLDVVCAIPVQTFNYIDQNHEEDGGLTLGVVAQDVQAVAPELVSENNWGSADEPKMRLSIYQTDLQYALMKALQELNAKFDAYVASHP